MDTDFYCFILQINIFIWLQIGLHNSSQEYGTEPFFSESYTCSTSGHCYQVFSQPMTYTDAWSQCHEMNMHLAMPKTHTAVDFIRDNILGTRAHTPVWIGLTDSATEHQWLWQDLELLNDADSDWKLNEPKDSKENDEDCVEIQEFGWNNAQCTNLRPFLCEEYIGSCTELSPYVFGSKCYKLVTGNFIISTTPPLCTSNGGQLAMPKTEKMNIYIYGINYGDEDLWLGIYGRNNELKWLDGSNITSQQYSNFRDPFLPISNVNYSAYMTVNGKWVYKADGETHLASYVCEYNTSVLVDCGSIQVTDGNEIIHLTTTGFTHAVSCNVGYVPQFNTTTCEEDAMWRPVPDCLADCGSIQVTNGSAITNLTTAGSTHNIVCNAGYVAQFKTTTCQRDGMWQPVPNCLADCGDVQINNGHAITGVTAAGTTRLVTCNYGYGPQFNHTTCQINGTWTPVPNCWLVNCSFCPCNRLRYDNSSVDNDISDLEMDKSTLSKARRQHTSAKDDRVSSVCVGLSGVIILALLLGVIVVNDVLKIISFFRCVTEKKKMI